MTNLPLTEQGEDPWIALVRAGKLDRQGMAFLCCWEWYERSHEIPFLKQIVNAVKKRFLVTISEQRASEGRRLFEDWLFPPPRK
jgi:hypothetical protein